MLIHNALITGSLLVNGTGYNTGSFSGSFIGAVAGTTATASYVEYNNVANKPALVSGSSQITYSGLTGIPSGIVSGSSQVTYSGLTGIPSGIVSGSAQIASFGIFATTGSNQFNGDQSITGSLTVTGQVVAQTLNVQQVTSSIVYSSGSNIFGNSLANTQQFTGSVGMTGSLTVVGAGSFSSTLATEGNITVTANSAAVRVTESGGADVRMVAGGSSGFFGTYSNHPLQFLTDSATKMTLNSSGNLGLGVTPSAWGAATTPALQITSAALFNLTTGGNRTYFTSNAFFNGTNFIYLNSTSANMYLQYDGSHQWHIAPSGTAGNAISFTQAMTLDASGRLGIGTTSPNSTLQVRGDNGSSVSAVLRLRDTNSTSRTTRLQFEDYNGTLADGLIDFKIPTAGSATGARLDLGVDSAIISLVRGGNVGIGTSDPQSILNNFSSSARGLAISNSYPFLGLNDTDGGNFFIGTQANLAYVWNAGTDAMIFATNNAERMRITSGGNVVIGNTVASNVGLTIFGSNAATIYQTTNTGTGAGNGFYVGHTGDISYVWNYNNFPLVLATNNTERMRITSAGDVGIGTTGPSSKLHVAGTFRTALASGAGGQTLLSAIVGVSNGYIIDVDTSNNINHTWNTGANAIAMRITSVGRVGVGYTPTNSRFGVYSEVNEPLTATIGNSTDQGGAQFYKIVRHYPQGTNANKLIIPFVNQGSLNSNTIVRIMGHSARFNTAQSLGFTAEFCLGHLQNLSSLVVLSTTGNVSGIAINGMNIEISFTQSYLGSPTGGLFATIEYMTNVSSYSIIVPNIALN